MIGRHAYFSIRVLCAGIAIILWMMTSAHGCHAAEPGRNVKLRDGDVTLNAWLTEVAGRRATVLMVHGTMAHANMEIMSTLAGVFAEYGVETLRITLSLGDDDRHGMMPCEARQHHAHMDAIGEIEIWFRWLQMQGRESVIVLGHSRATNQIARFAAGPSGPAPAGLILVAPAVWKSNEVARRYADSGGQALGPLLDKARRLVATDRGDESLGEIRFLHCPQAEVTAAAFLSYYGHDPDFDTLAVVDRLTQPVIIFAGSEDPLTRRLDAAVEEMRRQDGVQFVMLEGADHFFRDLYAYDLVEATLSWFETLSYP